MNVKYAEPKLVSTYVRVPEKIPPTAMIDTISQYGLLMPKDAMHTANPKMPPITMGLRPKRSERKDHSMTA